MQNRILIVLENGAFKGASISTDTGAPAPLDEAALAALFPDLNAAALGEIERLGIDHAAEIAELRADHEASIESLKEEHARQIASMTPVAPESPAVLQALGSAYSELPLSVQVTFAPAFATVRALIEGGRVDLAAEYVAGLDVPDELLSAKAGIVETLSASAA